MKDFNKVVEMRKELEKFKEELEGCELTGKERLEVFPKALALIKEISAIVLPKLANLKSDKAEIWEEEFIKIKTVSYTLNEYRLYELNN